MHVWNSKTPTEKDLESIDRLAFCVRLHPSNRQIEKGSMVGLYRSYGQTNDEETDQMTVGL